ncbi:MAG: hypothetical protein JSR92_12830 [Proteobacteria bacterium]|nr:hypothetical protein [Pseudomonadota bacterium]
MNASNVHLSTQWSRAAAAIAHLDALGAAVLRVKLGERMPVLDIDAAPDRFVHGVLAKRETICGIQRRTMVATVRGCKVQWLERRVLGVGQALAKPAEDDDELPPVLGEALRDLADPYRIATRDDADGATP